MIPWGLGLGLGCDGEEVEVFCLEEEGVVLEGVLEGGLEGSLG